MSLANLSESQRLCLGRRNVQLGVSDLFRIRCVLGSHKPDRKLVTYEAMNEYAPCRYCGRTLRHTGPGLWRASRNQPSSQ